MIGTAEILDMALDTRAALEALRQLPTWTLDVERRCAAPIRVIHSAVDRCNIDAIEEAAAALNQIRRAVTV